MTKTDPTPAELLARLQTTRAEMQQALDAMLDPRDTPGSWTQRQKDAYEECRHRLPQHIGLCSTLMEQLTKAVATRAARLPERDRLLAAKAAIEQMIKDAPDWRTVADNRARDAEYDRQRWLADSLTAIQHGVPYHANTGQPALPIPLRALLTDTCASCGHEMLKWQGPLGPLDEEIEKAEAVIATGPASLASLRASVTPYLAEAAIANDGMVTR